MPFLPLNNQAKRKPPISKSQLWLFDTCSKKNVANSHAFIQLVYFIAFTFISYSIVWPFIFSVLYFSWFNIACFMKHQTGMAIK